MVKCVLHEGVQDFDWGELVIDLLPKVRTTVDERTSSVMLVGTRATYEHKENIVFTGVRVKC